MTRTHQKATSVVFIFPVISLLILLLGPKQAASMCQCGIYVLWENNRVGEEILLGEPMRGRCRAPQSVNTRLEQRCKTYCSTRSDLLTNGGNLAVMGTFLSMATKFYACQMLHSMHQDPNGYHTHLGQSRVESFWVGSFYRYCQHDWKFAGRESIRQVCCQRSDFLVCPAGVRSESPPDFKLPEPPPPALPVKAAKEETPAPADASPSPEVMKAAMELVIKMMGELNVTPPAMPKNAPEPGPTTSSKGITPAQEALMALLAKNGANQSQPLLPLEGPQGSQQQTVLGASQQASVASGQASMPPTDPTMTRNQQQFLRGLMEGDNQMPGTTRLQPPSGSLNNIRNQQQFTRGLAGGNNPLREVAELQSQSASSAPIRSHPQQLIRGLPVSSNQMTGATRLQPPAALVVSTSPRSNPSVIVRRPSAQQAVQFFTGTRNVAQSPVNQGQPRPLAQKTDPKGSFGPNSLPGPKNVAAGKGVTLAQGFISLTQPAGQIVPSSTNSWTPIYSPPAEQSTPAMNYYDYQMVTPKPMEHYPVYPPVEHHHHKKPYSSGMYNSHPAHQYFASRMDAATGDASLGAAVAPLPELPPESGLEISSSSLLDQFEQGGFDTFDKPIVSKPVSANFGNNVQFQVSDEATLEELGVWALDKFDPSILEPEPNKAGQSNEDGSRFLIAPPSRPRPTFPFRPHSHNTSSLAYVDFSMGLLDAFLAEMGVPTIGRIMEEMDYSRTEFQDDIQRMERAKNFVHHEVNLGYCYAEFLFFDLFKNRHSYGFTFFGDPVNSAGRRRGDQDDPFKDSFFLAFWRFLGRMRREGVATPIVSFLRRGVRDVVSGAKRLLWRRGRRRHRRRTRRSVENSHNPSFLRVLGRTLATVLTDESRVQRSLSRKKRHDGDAEAAGAAMRDALSSNLRPFAIGPLSTFLDYLLESNSPKSSYYCLKNYVSSKLYFWLGKGLKSFLFT